MVKQHKAVYLDLNGTLVMPLKQESLDELVLIPGADQAVRRLLAAGFLCPVVTVQARIEKGLFTERQFRTWFEEFFKELGLDLKGPYICPHRYNHRCLCEKPNRLLYDKAASDLSLDLSRCYTIGDSRQDVEAAHRFGGVGCLVRTGWAADRRLADAAQDLAAYTGETIADVVEWILRREKIHGQRPQRQNEN